MTSRKSSGSSLADRAVEPNEVAEHHRELTTHGFGSLAAGAVGFYRTLGRLAKSLGSQRGDRIEENAAMADRRHAEVSEVVGGQLGQDCLIDRVFPECLLVAFQAEAAQPGRDIHGIHTHTWPHSSNGHSRRHVGRYVSRAPSVEPLADQAVAPEGDSQFTPPHGAKHVFLAREALESADQPRSEPVRTPQRTAHSSRFRRRFSRSPTR